MAMKYPSRLHASCCQFKLGCLLRQLPSIFLSDHFSGPAWFLEVFLMDICQLLIQVGQVDFWFPGNFHMGIADLFHKVNLLPANAFAVQDFLHRILFLTLNLYVRGWVGF